MSATPAFRLGGTRPPAEVMRAFVDQHRNVHGFERICRTLYGRAADAPPGGARRDSWQCRAHYGGRAESAVPVRHGQPALQGRTSFGSRTAPMSRLGRAGGTWPSSSTSSPGELAAGGPATRHAPISCSTRLSSRCAHASPIATTAHDTTPTAVASTSRSATTNGWPRPASSRR